jgi:hypothetical protein
MTVVPATKKGKKLSEVSVDFSGKNLTGFGGLAGFAEFIKRLGLPDLLDGVKVQHWGLIYSAGRLMQVLLLGFVAGMDRMTDVASLRKDSVLLRILGWMDWPVQSTLTRFLRRFSEAAVVSLQDVMGAALERFRDGWRSYNRLHIDFDSHVRTVHGKTLEEAHVGYNPNKKGRPSYHPIMAFVGETKDILRGQFRPGNVRSANGIVEFFKKCLKQLGWERLEWLIVRADSGFCELEFLQALESCGERLKYVIALKFFPHHVRHFSQLNFTPIPGSRNFEIASYQSFDWADWRNKATPENRNDPSAGRRIVVVREAIPDEGRKGLAGKQLNMFPELKNYLYRAYVTCSKAPAVEIWRDYNGRATCENVIKEAICLGLDVNATRKYLPNAAHFLLTLLACNLLNWYKEIAIGTAVKRMPKWIRQSILCVPAKLVTSGRQLILKFPSDWAWRELLKKACELVKKWELAPACG